MKYVEETKSTFNGPSINYCVKGCKYLEETEARCEKYNTPVPVNYKLDFLKCDDCREEANNEGKGNT